MWNAFSSLGHSLGRRAPLRSMRVKAQGPSLPPIRSYLQKPLSPQTLIKFPLILLLA